MGMHFDTRWISRGWIMCVVFTFYAQITASKSLQCEETQYLRKSRCCEKCGPGFRVFSRCTDSQRTKCIKCSKGEYQPGWTEDERCLQQKYCDIGKGFIKSPENLLAEEPCRCRADLQCHPINCEFCEKIPTCRPGFGLEVDPGSTNERKICIPCHKGFYSADFNSEPCKQWTNCNAEGRNELQPGSARADAKCGVIFSGTAPWVIVSVLSVITVLCLLILLLFCYKDKLKLLSVNLRSCVQNLKRTRIQQETLAPLYPSGAAGGGIGGGPGGLRGSPCEITKLICQTPCSPENEPSNTFPFTEEMTDKGRVQGRTATEDQSEGSGEPQEVSEEELFSVSPLLAGSCMCVIPIHEPLEVGENEDCTQAVSSGMSGTCSCGGLEGQKDGDETGREDKSDSKRAGSQENMGLSTTETYAASLVSLSSPLVHPSSVVPPISPSSDFCLPLSQAQVKLQLSSDGTDRSPVKQEGLHRLTSTDSPLTDTRTTSPLTSVSPLMTSLSVGHLYLDKPPEASSPERGQGITWEDRRENKLPLGESELECQPESLHSQLAEPTPTSGLVSGNHNTTFISSGQVMNFSSDVIVVYVSQMSHDSDEGMQGDAFGSPVQEEASETAPFFQNSLRSQGNSISHSTLAEETLPVQEVMEEQLVGK
ncbi:tumor necrosis factor receptor superfamily member 11A [Cololabis saira]|uniref:tumor necrosis factor receptor superfamily member 11A n=1 Tax=Cololabis saira TaxID=129043 RepID=UPI002AD38C5C|nr:tumor necrosis factor receptor superfamily member 11A [Cololabis saira]